MRGGLGRFPSFPSTRSTNLDRSAIETAKALGGLDVPPTLLARIAAWRPVAVSTDGRA
jgi:hypothetical protein